MKEHPTTGNEVRGHLSRITFVVIFVALFLFIGSALWIAIGVEKPLAEPVMNGKPIVYWLEIMATTDRTEEIQDKLVSLGPSVTRPLLAALHYRPSPWKLKVAGLFYGRFPHQVQRWLLHGSRSVHSYSAMAARTLAAMPPDPRIRDGLFREVRRAISPREDGNIGFYAVHGLAEHYTNEPTITVPVLRSALKVPHDNIQAAAALALPRFGRYGLVALPDLIPLLSGADDSLSSRTATALGLFGSMASNTLPAIQPLLTHNEPEVRRLAAVAVWRIVPKAEFPTNVLLSSMREGRPQERLKAAQQLWELGHACSQQVVETLIELVKSKPEYQHGEANHWHRWRAAEILGELGTEAETALPVLLEAERSDGNEQLKRLGTCAKTARERIEKALVRTVQTKSK
jgi:HEAT repeat protein